MSSGGLPTNQWQAATEPQQEGNQSQQQQPQQQRMQQQMQHNSPGTMEQTLNDMFATTQQHHTQNILPGSNSNFSLTGASNASPNFRQQSSLGTHHSFAIQGGQQYKQQQQQMQQLSTPSYQASNSGTPLPSLGLNVVQQQLIHKQANGQAANHNFTGQMATDNRANQYQHLSAQLQSSFSPIGIPQHNNSSYNTSIIQQYQQMAPSNIPQHSSKSIRTQQQKQCSPAQSASQMTNFTAQTQLTQVTNDGPPLNKLPPPGPGQISSFNQIQSTPAALDKPPNQHVGINLLGPLKIPSLPPMLDAGSNSSGTFMTQPTSSSLSTTKFAPATKDESSLPPIGSDFDESFFSHGLEIGEHMERSLSTQSRNDLSGQKEKKRKRVPKKLSDGTTLQTGKKTVNKTTKKRKSKGAANPLLVTSSLPGSMVLELNALSTNVGGEKQYVNTVKESPAKAKLVGAKNNYKRKSGTKISPKSGTKKVTKSRGKGATLISAKQTIDGYNELIAKLKLQWESLATILNPKTYASDENSIIRTRLIAIIIDMLDKPLLKHSKISIIEDAKKKMVMKQLYSNHLVEDFGLPELVSDECRLLNTNCKVALEKLSSMRKNPVISYDAFQCIVFSLEKSVLNIEHISHSNDEYSIAIKKSIKLSKQAEMPETDVQRKKMAEAKRRHRDNMKKREDEILGNKHRVGNSVNEEIISTDNEMNQEFYSSLGNGKSGFVRKSESLKDRCQIPVLSTSIFSVNEIANEDDIHFELASNFPKVSMSDLEDEMRKVEAVMDDLQEKISSSSEVLEITKLDLLLQEKDTMLMRLKMMHKEASDTGKQMLKSPKQRKKSLKIAKKLESSSDGRKAKRARRKKVVKENVTYGDTDQTKEAFSGQIKDDESTEIELPLKDEIKIHSKVTGVKSSPSESIQKDVPDNILETKRQSKKRKVTIIDRQPNRIVNPLLELPQYPHVPKGAIPGSLPVDSLPQGAEFWKVMPLYFPEPDTFPISYLARILGFDVQQLAPINGKNNYFDPMRIPFHKRGSKSDPWLLTPVLGKFYNQVFKKSQASSRDKNGTQIARQGEEIDFVDPMWKTIMTKYRGYKDDFFKAASLQNNVEIISRECLSFAQKLNIISDDFKFRIATVGDERILSDLNKDGVRYPHSSSFTQAISCPSQFFIIGSDKSQVPFGFIHYKLCWYKLQQLGTSNTESVPEGSYGMPSTAGNIKKDTALELVLHIESVQTSKEGLTKKVPHERNFFDEKVKRHLDLENIPALILTALALEHARRLDIWYGMMEVTSDSVYFFKKFFRMTELQFQNKDARSTAYMACDLTRCNYRYAFLLKKEMAIKPISATTRERERVLVTLSTTARSAGLAAGKRDLPSESDDDSELSNLITPLKKPQLIFSGTGETSKCKAIKVQLELPQNLYSLEESSHELGCMKSPAKITILNEPEKSEEQKASNIHDQNLKIGQDIDWEILKNFPLIDAIPLKTVENTKVQRQQYGENDFVLNELLRNRQKLNALESKMIPKLRFLLKNAYEERMHFESIDMEEKRNEEVVAMKEYDCVIDRRREADIAWQMQLEQDMDAVCDICNDGEVTPDNQILFCEACNVAVHQRCYSIGQVPAGDYFCHACRYFKRDRQAPTANNGNVLAKTSPSPLPISCELCPRKQGAFIKTFDKKSKRKGLPPKWVHVLCAKWQGLNFIDPSKPDEIEDITELKGYFRINDYQCCLCKGFRGAYNKCSREECNNWMHVTCARSSGLCNVYHGENHMGLTQSKDSWTLLCPEHSTFDPEHEPVGCLTIEQLVAAAKAFPPEPKPEPPPKPFNKMNSRERKKHLDDPDYEEEFLRQIMKRNEGLRCMLCDEPNEFLKPSSSLSRCSACQVAIHKECFPAKWTSGQQKDGEKIEFCNRCIYIQNKKNSPEFEVPSCHMCNQKGGALLEAFAKPLNKKRWKDNTLAFKRSLFGKDIWCHAICAMWHPKTILIDERVDCTNIIMSNGTSHIDGKEMCYLCGRKDKVKASCKEPGCRVLDLKKNGPYKFHITCARQAGLHVTDEDIKGKDTIEFTLKCFHHMRSDLVLRALLEDMIEVERIRAGNDFANAKGPMSWESASKIFNWGVRVLRSLGWAWRWVDWWVERGDNWEPLLEQGQNEMEMTPEELGIIKSTPESRCDDARRCRLAAFGAALRNRDYDKEDGDDQIALTRALRAILHTPSLVGPLPKVEIEFFVEWLARAYRSKSQLLGFGADKIPVMEAFEEGSCVHYKNSQPKFSLGSRSLPGKQKLAKGAVFETNFNDYDDFNDYMPPKLPLSQRIPRKKQQ